MAQEASAAVGHRGSLPVALPQPGGDARPRAARSLDAQPGRVRRGRRSSRLAKFHQEPRVPTAMIAAETAGEVIAAVWLPEIGSSLFG